MEQFDFFGLTDSSVAGEANQIKIVNAKYVSSEMVSGKTLFSGFNDLYAITYSSGIKFLCNIVDKFDYAEIIFGCEELVGDGLAITMALQAKIIEKFTKNKNYKRLCERIEAGTLKLFVSRTTKSHEKIFCLKSNDGRFRVITGSANMSASAFCGIQRENIVRFDEQIAYKEFKTHFDTFRENCSDNVNLQVLQRTSENSEYLEETPEEIPVLQTLEKRQILLLEPADDENNECEIVADIKGLEQELKPMMPKPVKEGGKILLTSEHFHAIKSKSKVIRAEKKVKRKKLPKLHLDYELHRMDFNGAICNLNPEPSKVKQDIYWLFRLLDDLKSFYGNVADAQKEYYAFLNWYFSSVFAPYLRYVASKNDGITRQYPTVGIVYGDSDGGKSTFLQLLSKLMCGVKLPLNSSSDFTATNIESLRRACEGVPLVFDDLDKGQFKNHADKIIKDDEWGIADHFIHYPAVAITTNKLPSLEDALSKRAIGCRISIKIDKELGMKNGKRINQCIKNVTNSLYCEYIRRMFPKIDEMVEHLKKDEETEAPDLFAVSSSVLIDIFEDFWDAEIPTYVSHLSHSDYFGDRVVGKNAIRKILDAWENEPSQFRVDKKKNKLIYFYPENANVYELKYICDELPASLNAQRQSKSLYMDLDAAQRFFGVKFQKSLFGNK